MPTGMQSIFVKLRDWIYSAGECLKSLVQSRISVLEEKLPDFYRVRLLAFQRALQQ